MAFLGGPLVRVAHPRRVDIRRSVRFPRRRSLSAARGVLAIACDLVLRRSSLLTSPRRRWPSWADRRRVSSSSSWFLLVVGRRCSSSSCLLALGCRCRPCWPCGSFRRLVSSFALSSRLACRWGVAICVPSSRAARCSACVPWFRSFLVGGRLAPCPSRRPCLLFPVSVSCGFAAAVEDGRLVSGCAACLVLSQSVRDGARASRSCVLLAPDTNIAPSLLSWGRGDISSLVGFSIFR